MSRDNWRRKLSGDQNHRCAFCHVTMTFAHGYNNSISIAKIEMGLQQGREEAYLNTFACCYLCASRRQNQDAYEFAEKVAREGRPPLSTKQEQTKSTNIAEIQEKILEIAKEKLATEYAHIPESFFYSRKYSLIGLERASTEHYCKIADSIVKGVVKGFQSYTYRQNLKQKRRENGGVIRTASYSSIRKKLSEAQNHRCCYCGLCLQLENSRLYDYATLEHIIEQRNGGDDSFDNLVIACTTCNNLRDILDMTPEEFYEYVQENGIVYQRNVKDSGTNFVATKKMFLQTKVD